MQYLRQSSTRIGQKYKKAVYTLYKNESFTERLESKQRKTERGIIGPVIRAQIRDVIKVRQLPISTIDHFMTEVSQVRGSERYGHNHEFEVIHVLGYVFC